MSLMKLLPMLACVATVASGAAQSADAPALCATPEQAAKVREIYAQPPARPPFMVAPKLGLTDAAVLSALPADKAVGTSGSAFLTVWESLQAWERTLTLVIKGGHTFEIFGRIPGGAFSQGNPSLHLTVQEAGLGGHVRPELVAAIYAITLQGPESPLRGVMFLDPKGEHSFSVFLTEMQKPTAAEVAQFETTKALIAGLPRTCT